MNVVVMFVLGSLSCFFMVMCVLVFCVVMICVLRCWRSCLVRWLCECVGWLGEGGYV